MNCFCKICGCETREVLNHRLGVNYYWCDHCEFIAKDTGAMVSTEEALALYNTHRNSIEDLRYVAYFKNFLDQAVTPFQKHGRRGLDFGSGPSPVLSMILEGDYGYTMDIYDLFYAPERVYEGQCYDLITSTEVIEHLVDPMAFLRTLKALLAPEGIIAIMTQFQPKEVSQFENWHYLRDETHIGFFTPTTMNHMARTLGLRVIYSNDLRYTTFALAEGA